MYIKNFSRRFHAVSFFFLIFLSLLVIRLLYIYVFKSQYLEGIAKKQHNLYIELEPRRGAIFDRNMRPQAINVSADSVFASPRLLKDKEKIVRLLAPILNVDYKYLRERLYKNKAFVWLARKISPDQAQKIKALKLKNIGFIKESKRCYPNGYLASHVIGFAGLDNSGLEGIEADFNSYLKGANGWAIFLRDARQNRLELWQDMAPPKDGYNLVLTIDEVIQYIAERELDAAFKKYHAKAASIIVMNPHTGEILALANRPTFDLNNTSNSALDIRRNRAICDLFEPGSVFKIVTASAAIEEKRLSESDRIFCENGEYRVANHILHDHEPHGWLTFKDVIGESSNIGTTKIAQMLGPDIVYKYVKLFGFGTKTGVDLDGEINGMIKEPRFWSKTSIGAVPIGQEVGVTSMQLAVAISAIANGGQLVRPYIVKEAQDKYKETIKEFKPSAVVVRQVISPATASRMRKILEGVIEEGTGRLAQVPGYSAGGKTGTAQKLEPDGSYSHRKFVASFIGFAPAHNPELVIVVTLDEPRPYYYGGVVSAPVFKNVASDSLKYLGVNPDKPLSKAKKGALKNVD